MADEIRWIQRLGNYKKALARLSEVASPENPGEFSDLEKAGMIQRFEYTFELAWKTLWDLLEFNGHNGA